jgi:hypothetical protein
MIGRSESVGELMVGRRECGVVKVERGGRREEHTHASSYTDTDIDSIDDVVSTFYPYGYSTSAKRYTGTRLHVDCLWLWVLKNLNFIIFTFLVFLFQKIKNVYGDVLFELRSIRNPKRFDLFLFFSFFLSFFFFFFF